MISSGFQAMFHSHNAPSEIEAQSEVVAMKIINILRQEGALALSPVQSVSRRDDDDAKRSDHDNDIFISHNHKGGHNHDAGGTTIIQRRKRIDQSAMACRQCLYCKNCNSRYTLTLVEEKRVQSPTKNQLLLNERIREEEKIDNILNKLKESENN
eukprot:UN26496